VAGKGERTAYVWSGYVFYVFDGLTALKGMRSFGFSSSFLLDEDWY
jgi:hypothetical protein